MTNNVVGKIGYIPMSAHGLVLHPNISGGNYEISRLIASKRRERFGRSNRTKARPHQHGKFHFAWFRLFVDLGPR